MSEGRVNAMNVMLQLVVYLLAIYLVFKSFEILQQALTSGRDDTGRSIALVLGGVALLLSLIIAGTFFYIASQQGEDFTALLLGEVETASHEARTEAAPRRVSPGQGDTRALVVDPLAEPPD